MLTKLREPFGKAGLIIAIVALIAAMGGGAYAASGGLSGKQKKEVTKIARKEAMKYAGKEGKQGPGGTSGPAGVAGAKGNTGEKGDAGNPGKSVTVTEIEPGQSGCEARGGAELKQEGASSGTEICNGAAGSPWTVGGKLPKGATETGTWTVSANPDMAEESGNIFVPVSFPVPLAAELGFEKAHFVPPLGEGSCEGNYAEPSAPEGELCIYEAELHHISFAKIETLEFGPSNAGITGGVMVFDGVEDHAWGFGSWAVTGR